MLLLMHNMFLCTLNILLVADLLETTSTSGARLFYQLMMSSGKRLPGYQSLSFLNANVKWTDCQNDQLQCPVDVMTVCYFLGAAVQIQRQQKSSLSLNKVSESNRRDWSFALPFASVISWRFYLVVLKTLRHGWP